MVPEAQLCSKQRHGSAKLLFHEERVVVLQSFMFAVYEEASQNIQNATGPIDDGYITNVVGALPGDALCCSGPEKLDDGMPQAVFAFKLN